MTPSLHAYVLRLGDNALVLSQRLSEWCGKAPALEEDMALVNVALDLLGQARLWLSLAGELEGKGRDEDALAYLRDEHEFSNVLLVEQPNADYAHTLMRQWYFDAWHDLALARLCESTDARVAAIAAKARKEVAYHLRRSHDLLLRLGDGSELSHRKMQEAADALWPYTGELFSSDAITRHATDSGVGFDPAALREPWQQRVAAAFADATLRLPPADAWMHEGGTRGMHTESMGYLLAEMQVLARRHPGARW
ncbi:MAG TPA: 1,2-phenylacetyl-CoA epoxidase subunit PaaC [Stenotrophomonas sp.]|nr:1,2-phenylacetyl-CoA epoxidase subunit PaaC [Stenotrophomonas sp.]